MKKGIFIYIGFIIMFFIALYYISLSEVVLKAQNDLSLEIFSTAKDTGNFDEFVKYQVDYYKEVDEVTQGDYRFTFFHIVIDESNRLLAIIYPIDGNSIKFANDFNDLDDHTSVFLKSKASKFDSKDSQGSISYGYDESQVGFIFFDVEFTKDDNIEFSYTDYDNNLILNQTLIVTKMENDDLSFENGYTLDEIKDKMDLDNKITKILTTRILIYLAIVIFAPFIYKLIKVLIDKRSVSSNKTSY